MTTGSALTTAFNWMTGIETTTKVLATPKGGGLRGDQNRANEDFSSAQVPVLPGYTSLSIVYNVGNIAA